MKIFSGNHGNCNYAFFLNALFSALVFATLFIINDMIDDYLEKFNLLVNKKHSYKLGIHFVVHIVFFMVVLYLMHFFFGFGLDSKAKC